jgi:hypothetical protein
MSYRSNGDLPLGGIVILIVIVLFIGFGWSCVANGNEEIHTNVTVDSKERVCDGKNTCKYLVFTDKGTYEVTDSVLRGRWNSSDVYGRLNEGQTYTFKVTGFRMPFFSSYQNIIEVTEGETPEIVPAKDIPRTSTTTVPR